MYPIGPKVIEPELLVDRYVTADGEILPVRRWLPELGEPHAVLVAVHGFNDYSQFFQSPGDFLKARGIASFAYDQRGFGGSSRRGRWGGTEAYVDDLRHFIALVKAKHPNAPLYLLGESMGGAVAINLLASPLKPEVDGLVLVAPAVWGRATMPWYQRAALWSLAHSMPWLTLTGRNLGIMASDNIAMLRAMGKDPLAIKATRVEAMYGVADLMDAAVANATAIEARTLLLYGEQDQIIPKQPTRQFIEEFLSNHAEIKTIAIYPNGYHMLLRDLNAALCLEDIAAWMTGGDVAHVSHLKGSQ